MLWHYDSSDGTPQAKRSWSDFAGYSTVVTTHGVTGGQQNITKTLRNDALKPFHRLRQWFDIQFDFLKQADFRNGCLIGNFSAEVGAHSDTIHAKLAEMHVEIHESVVYCLKAAVKSGELPGTIDSKELAHFLYSSLQGAILQAKVERSPLPLKRFIKIAFSTILR